MASSRKKKSIADYFVDHRRRLSREEVKTTDLRAGSELETESLSTPVSNVASSTPSMVTQEGEQVGDQLNQAESLSTPASNVPSYTASVVLREAEAVERDVDENVHDIAVAFKKVGSEWTLDERKALSEKQKVDLLTNHRMPDENFSYPYGTKKKSKSVFVKISHVRQKFRV